MLAMGVQAQHGGAKALVGVVTSFKEPLGQLSIQQELPRGNVWGRKPHPASGLCLGREQRELPELGLSRGAPEPTLLLQEKSKAHQLPAKLFSKEMLPAPASSTWHQPDNFLQHQLAAPRIHGVALEGRDAERLEVSPKH